jgi:hypothetical protein
VVSLEEGEGGQHVGHAGLVGGVQVGDGPRDPHHLGGATVAELPPADGPFDRVERAGLDGEAAQRPGGNVRIDPPSGSGEPLGCPARAWAAVTPVPAVSAWRSRSDRTVVHVLTAIQSVSGLDSRPR